MTLLKFIKRRPQRIGGEQHTGWLPAGAATPMPTPIREILLELEIQFDGFGYPLCYSSTDGTLSGDTWHETIDDAESAAAVHFGIAASEWVSPQEE